MRAHQPRALFLLTFLLSLFLVACFGGHGGGGGGGGNGGGGGGNGGGGGGNGGGGGTNSPGAVTIIEPSVQFPLVVAGSTLDFEADVKGGNGMSVTWGVQSGDSCSNSNFTSSLGVVGGAGNVGTMPATTPKKAVATYTAPNASALAGSAFITVTITALQSPETTGPCVVAFVVASNNSLLTGNFAFRLRGFSSSSGFPFGIIGRFRADGISDIVNGFEDVNIAQSDGSSAAFTKVAFTGTYSMDTSSHGTMTLTVTSPPWGGSPPANPPPTAMSFSFTLSLDGTFGGLIETDGGATPAYVGSGDFQFQANSSKFTTADIVNNYILSLAGPGGVGANVVNKGFIGRVDLAASGPLSGTIISGVNSAADDQSGAGEQTLTGTYTIDDQANGHGTLTITGTINTTNTVYTISFYIGYPRFFYALRTDNNVASAKPDGILLGAVSRLLVTPPFTNTSLGSAAFEMLGITDSHSANGQGHASAAVGVVVGGAQIQPPSTTNGFLQGIVDLNDGGTVPNGPISINSAPPNLGTFTIAPMGRGTISITLPGPTVPVTYNFVFYLNGQGGGFLLEQPASDGSNRGRSGSFFPQTVTSGGIDTFIASTDVATAKSESALAVLPLTVSGSSGAFQNATGYSTALGSASVSAPLSGTFTGTDANNRGTATITSGSLAGSRTAAFYVASNTEVIVIGTDATNLEPQILLLTNTLPVNR